MGFVPAERDWKHVCDRIRRFLQLMNGELQDGETELLTHTAEHRDPKAVRQLSLLDRELVNCPIAEFEGHTVGRALLAHTGMRFRAVLDLSDDDNLAYFWDYVGSSMDG